MTQIQHRFSRTILLACAFIAVTGFAKADIVRCIDADGMVLITDAPCNADANTVQAPASAKATRSGGKGSPEAKRFAAAEQARTVAWANKPATGRRIALDVATLKAAKVTMVSNDQASTLVRQEALAERATRPGFWELWRS